MTAAAQLATPARYGGSRGAPRWVFAVLSAGVVTFALFAVMQILVATEVITLEEPAPTPPVTINFDIPEKRPNRIRDLPAVEPVDPPPQSPRIETSSQVPSQNPTYAPPTPRVDATEAAGPVEVALPPPPLQIRVPPAYPQRELSRGVEGQCTVRYDILASGATTNIQVLACDSPGFANASVEAVERWRHAARRGEAPNQVAVRGHMTTLEFGLE